MVCVYICVDRVCVFVYMWYARVYGLRHRLNQQPEVYIDEKVIRDITAHITTHIYHRSIRAPLYPGAPIYLPGGQPL